MCIVQGRNKFRWHLGQEISLPPLCSNIRSFGSKCTVLKKSACHCWYFLTSRSDSAPGELCPLAPSLRLWCYVIKIGKLSESKPIFKSERHEHLQFSNTIRHGSCTECQQRLLAAFQVSLFSFVSLLCLRPAFFRRGPVCFVNNKSFRTFNKLLFKVR